jgi:membrane-bound lytic murein transglycosylase D
LFLHPADYGLEFPQIDGSPGQVQLARAMTLNEITMCIGQGGTRDGWFRTLRNLNPRVDPARPMPVGTTVALPARAAEDFGRQCVDGRMAQLAAELQRARGTTTTSIAHGGGRKYVVRPGDTLASIAKRQGCSSPEALARANKIAAPRYLIKPAQQLTLAGCSA